MFYLFLTAAVLVAADQLIKLWVVRTVAVTGAVPLVPGLLDVTYLQNTGAAWSVLQRHTWVLTVVSLAVILLIIWALAARKIKGGVGRWSLAVLLGGAVGNLIDRIRLGTWWICSGPCSSRFPCSTLLISASPWGASSSACT